MNFKNILTSGYSFNQLEYELKLKYILFNSLLIFNILVVGLAVVIRFTNAEYSQGVFDLIYVLSGLFTFFFARRSKIHFNKLVYFVIFLSFIIVTLTFSANINPISGISWYLILLISAFFLLDQRKASFVFIISLVLIIFISTYTNKYSLLESIFGIIPFLIALSSMYFFENRNKHLKEQLKDANETLESYNHELKGLVQISNTKLNASKKEIATLNQIIDKSPVSIIITDTDGNIEYSNPWFSKLTGYSSTEVKGLNPRILKSDLHSGNYYTKLWRDISNGSVWNGTFKNISKSGQEYWESAIIAPVDNEDGKLTHYIAIKQEITQQVYLKDKLIQKDKERTENFEKTLESFVRMVEERDTYTAGHSQRVADYSLLIAKEMNYSPEKCKLMYRAAILHDIGKIATPDNVLLKPGKLTTLEYKLIKEHVSASYEILAGIPMYKELADIIIHHHERYDGGGYPSGLSGDKIPIFSHIMILADAFDAMTTNRIYKGRKNISQAIKEIELCSGQQFHPTVVQSARKALIDVELLEQIDQLPKTDLEKERFSYFYKDRVTDIYNGDYLKFILNQNKFKKEYDHLCSLYMHNFSKFNSKHGWDKGDKFLTEFAQYLNDKFPSTLIFRIYGNDFILINKEFIDIDMQQFEELEILTSNNISITKSNFNLITQPITKLEELVEKKG